MSLGLVLADVHHVDPEQLPSFARDRSEHLGGRHTARDQRGYSPKGGLLFRQFVAGSVGDGGTAART